MVIAALYMISIYVSFSWQIFEIMAVA